MRTGRARRRRLCLVFAVGAVVALVGWPTRVIPAEAPKKLNAYTGKADAIKEGRALYLKYGCSACHGVMGGGGMGPALTDDVWKFGSSDEVIYKLIKGQIPNATMPKVLGQQMTDDEIWKIIAYVRTLYVGDPSKVNW